MEPDELDDLLTEIDTTGSVTDRAERFEDAAAGLEPGTHGRSVLLVAAAEHRQMRAEYAEAQRLLDLAEADGGHRAGDLHASRLSVALDAGEEDTVSGCVAGLKALARHDDLSLDALQEAGEAFEGQDRHREALRWFSLPFTYADPADEESLDDGCLAGRYRVRRALGLGTDRFDHVAARRFPALRP